MTINFKELTFEIKDGRITLSDRPFVEVQILGENKGTHLGAKMTNSSEGRRLTYLSHTLTESALEIIQRSELVKVKTTLTSYPDTNAIRISTEVENISGDEIILEEVSAFVYSGFGTRGIDSAKELYLTRFTQSHHAECQPRRISFSDAGFFRANNESQKRLAFANVGSWSTKEELPQGIIEDTESGCLIMFEIESNNSWYYEIADNQEKYYLYLSGANLPFGGWSKALKPTECYRTVNVALAFGSSVNSVIAEMTTYRRKICGKCIPDESLPTIFNEYMHLSWDSPTEENTKKIAPVAASAGIEYYVIDCGWHNEEDGDKIYPYIGQWKESLARFPSGVRATTDYIRSLGMKAGLWIEPEVIGIYCEEMLSYYDDDCFIQRNGKRLAVMGRHFLDFRARKVNDYLTEAIRRMVNDYGADYIKFDYNQDLGVGTDYLAFCAGEGLEQCAEAYLGWVERIRAEFPTVVFESCSSGGMRMDYRTLSHFSICSTSDQTDYVKYPYISANISAAVLPEQAAVWSYPVGVGEVGKPLLGDAAWVDSNITKERITMNMINSLLGRMHLASHIELLSAEKLELIKEGVECYNRLSEVKKRALPYFPNGFSSFGDTEVCSGLLDGDELYLAVWNLSERNKSTVKLDRSVVAAEILYPGYGGATIGFNNDTLDVCFDAPSSAVLLKISLR